MTVNLFYIDQFTDTVYQCVCIFYLLPITVQNMVYFARVFTKIKKVEVIFWTHKSMFIHVVCTSTVYEKVQIKLVIYFK